MKGIIGIFDRSKNEVSKGFFETRRQMLWLPASLGASVVTGRAGVIERVLGKARSAASSAISLGSGLDWEGFLQLCVPVAGELHKDSSPPGQEAYLYWVASMISRTSRSAIPRAKVGRFEKLEPAVRFGVSYRGRPFFIVEWQLEPRALLPPHCHPNVSVCTVGLEGEAEIRNFEIVGAAPEFSSRKSFLVRETHSEIIADGRINTLSATRDNIHTFRAGKNGARGIDISTYHGPDVGFSFLEIAGKPKGGEGRVFEASWSASSR
jgi:hypothetical protein